MTKQSLGGPFKPSFGLSGVVADQAIRSVSLGAKPRNLQVPPPVSNAYGETVLFIGSSLTRRDELWPEMNVKTNADSIGFIFCSPGGKPGDLQFGQSAIDAPGSSPAPSVTPPKPPSPSR